MSPRVQRRGRVIMGAAEDSAPRNEGKNGMWSVGTLLADCERWMAARRGEYSLETLYGNVGDDPGWNEFEKDGCEMAVPAPIDRPSPIRGDDIALDDAAERSTSPASGADPWRDSRRSS